MRTPVLAALLLLVALAAPAVEPRERLADPALEARARSISSQLRCLVCQNESIDDSGADLAHHIRVFQVAIATLIGDGMPTIAIPSGDTPQ